MHLKDIIIDVKQVRLSGQELACVYLPLVFVGENGFGDELCFLDAEEHYGRPSSEAESDEPLYCEVSALAVSGRAQVLAPELDHSS